LGAQNQNNRKERRPVLLYLLIGAGVFLIIAAIWLALPKDNSQADQTGTPAITVKPEKIDIGEIKLDTPVSFEFDITNTGNGTLRFAEAPYIEVVEGC